MSRGKSVIGILVLSVLALGVVGAGSASASGMTAVECVEAKEGPGTGNFATSKCETPEEVKGNYETVAGPLNEIVEGEGKAIGTVFLEATIALVKVRITCEEMNATGKGANVEVGEEMKVHATEVVHKYTGCHARRVSAPGETCKISGGGTITTEKLTSTTLANHEVTVQPEGEGPFAAFEILNEGTECKIPKTKVTVTGTVIGIANTENHSHLTFTPATNGTKLKANGGAASVTGTTTGWKKGDPEGTYGGTTF